MPPCAGSGRNTKPSPEELIGRCQAENETFDLLTASFRSALPRKTAQNLPSSADSDIPVRREETRVKRRRQSQPFANGALSIHSSRSALGHGLSGAFRRLNWSTKIGEARDDAQHDRL